MPLAGAPAALWATVFCSLILSVPAESNGIKILEPIRRQRNVSAVQCIIQLCENYYSDPEDQKIGALLMVHIQNTTPFHDSLIKSLMERNNYAINLLNQYTRCNESCYINVTEKSKNYLVAFREMVEVEAALRLWSKLPTWNPLAKFVVVVMEKYEESVLFDKIKHILQAFFKMQAINVKVISFRNGSNVVQMHTWFPYEGTNCANEVRNIHLIDECSYSDDRVDRQPVRNIRILQELVPSHLHGCPLRVSTSAYEPFVFYDSVRNEFNRGIEIRLVHGIAQAMGMKAIFIPINDTRDNRHLSGIYSPILKRLALQLTLLHSFQSMKQMILNQT